MRHLSDVGAMERREEKTDDWQHLYRSAMFEAIYVGYTASDVGRCAVSTGRLII